MSKNIMTILLVLSLSLTVTSTEKAGSKKKENPCKNGWIFSPILYYTPETRLAFGAATGYVFRTDRCLGETRPSTLSPLFIYTLEKQVIAQLTGDIFFKDNNYHLKAMARFKKFPSKFYGTGNRTREEDEELFTSRDLELFLGFYKKIAPGFFAGVEYAYYNWDVTETEGGGRLETGGITGSGGGLVSGAGVVLRRDTRDNVFAPLRGDLMEFNTRFHPRFLGGDFAFTTITLDLRKYIPLFSKHVLALRGRLQTHSGTVPFMHLSKLGGPYLLRGYYEGRYRDKNLLAFQAEYRMPLFWRLGMAAFVSAGQVADRFKNLDPGNLKATYGFGVRYALDKKKRIFLRCDVGFGQGSSGVYFSIFEAF